MIFLDLFVFVLLTVGFVILVEWTARNVKRFPTFLAIVVSYLLFVAEVTTWLLEKSQ